MKKVAVVFLAMALLMTFATGAPAFAASTTITYGNANGMNYTQIIGALDGAAYLIRIPESWNGRLILGCTGAPATPNSHLVFDSLSLGLVAQGYAYASSNLGEEGYPIQKGVIRFHQLTEYIVSNYHVTDKIFLFGTSMGGQITLLLGEKYPELYSGVLDLCGLKNVTMQYDWNEIFVTHTVAELRAMFSWLSSAPDSAILGLKSFFSAVQALTIEETGGTPENRLQAYERISPINHLDIKIPIISVVGALDFIVPMPEHSEYKAAVVAAGHSDLYRMYIIANGGHINKPIMDQVPDRLAELMAWSDSLD